MNLAPIEELILTKINTDFSISSLSDEVRLPRNETYYTLVKLEKKGFVSILPYRLTRKGSTYLETFVKCNHQLAARMQRETELRRGEGLQGTKSYERTGCYSCNGLNVSCEKYYNHRRCM